MIDPAGPDREQVTEIQRLARQSVPIIQQRLSDLAIQSVASDSRPHDRPVNEAHDAEC